MDLDALERELGIPLPREYRELATRGRLDGPDYLWLFEAEWRTPRRLPMDGDGWPRTTEPLFQYARTGGGDPWCWRAASAGPLEVLECPRDCEAGRRYAPDFSGFLFRRALDFASGGFDEVAEARRQLRQWAAELRIELRPAWVELVREVAERPEQTGSYPAFVSADEIRAILGREWGPEWREDREVRWQR